MAKQLLAATKAAREASSTELWRTKIQVEAFKGREPAIAAMIDYACALTIDFLDTVIDDESKLTAEFLQREYLEARGTILHATIPYNAIMIATFFLVGLDISYRLRQWLKDYRIDWTKALVLILGKQGRETSGVTLSTNSVAQIVLECSDRTLPAERLFIAPHGPNISVEQSNIAALRQYEAPLRQIWNRNLAIGTLGETMFAGYPNYKLQLNQPVVTNTTKELSEMPFIHSPDDWMSFTTRIRIVLEDARQLLSGCVTDYAAQQLQFNGNDPTSVVVPGLDGFDYLNGPRVSIYPLPGFKTLASQDERISLSSSSVEIQTQFSFGGRSCEVPDGKIAFWEEGQGNQTIIWIHGLPLASQSWGAQRQYFSKSYSNVYVDLRGYGQSSKLPPGTEDVTQLYCDDLKALMDHLNLERAHIVGFASAGHVALRFVAQNPTRVKKLVTFNGTPVFRQKSSWPWGFSESQITKFTSAAARDGIEGITKLVLDPALVFRDITLKDAQKIIPWFRDMSFKAGVQTLLGFFIHISKDDDRHLMSSILAPTLLISGSLGQEVPSESGFYLRQMIPHARLVEIPGVDHFSFITRPELVNQLIRDFFTETN